MTLAQYEQAKRSILSMLKDSSINLSAEKVKEAETFADNMVKLEMPKIIKLLFLITREALQDEGMCHEG